MPWEDVAENSNSENVIPTFWDDIDIKPKEKDMALIDCPRCQKRLRVPVEYSGRLTCPSCSKAFARQNAELQYRIYDDGEWSIGADILFPLFVHPWIGQILAIIGFFIWIMYLLVNLFASL